MNDETIIRINRIVNENVNGKRTEEYAEVQFTRDELVIFKLATRKKNIDCSEKEYSDMVKVINAACAGFENDREYAEKYCGVKYRGNGARIRLCRNQFNALCIAVLSASKELRYVEAAYDVKYVDLQDKLVKVMDGFRNKKFSLIAGGDLWILYT